MTSDNKIEIKGDSVILPLFLVFITLKLTGNIDWSWIWVFAPLWIPLVIGLIAAGIAALFVKIYK